MIIKNKILLSRKLTYPLLATVSLFFNEHALGSSNEKDKILEDVHGNKQIYLMKQDKFINDMKENAKRDLGSFPMLAESKKLDLINHNEKIKRVLQETNYGGAEEFSSIATKLRKKKEEEYKKIEENETKLIKLIAQKHPILTEIFKFFL